jgi:large subunit ribosomal protein L20
MPRVKRSVHSQKKRRKVFKTAKGFRGGHGNLLRSAKEAIARALRYAYRDRRTKKRISAPCGSPVSTPRPARTGFPTAR